MTRPVEPRDETLPLAAKGPLLREDALPLVSVATPVFNGARYLRACIESVLSQSYANWEYTIVDNCSTDGSLAIAREYAEMDPRIKVQSNEEFVGAIENHNRAFRSISPEAKYCKLVSADDWLYPECIAKLVDVAERHPSVGLVGAYSVNADGVRTGGIPIAEEVLPGREAARLCLLGEIHSFWTPSILLYRATLVRAADPFYPGSAPSSDVEACLNCLQQANLGFVHQVLSFERLHDDMITAKTTNALKMNSLVLDRMRILMESGAELLTPAERDRREHQYLVEYFALLAVEVFHLRNREFWRLHRARLGELGHSIYDPRLARAIAAKLLDLTLNPKATTEKVLRRVVGRRRDLPVG
jgi:glycosyltransferase involved in cell wall biosynthesis